MRTPDSGLLAARRRAMLRDLVTERGPDTGRMIDRLKDRSGAGGEVSERLLWLQEHGGVRNENSADLSRRDGDTGEVFFMLDVSTLGGTDVLE